MTEEQIKAHNEAADARRLIAEANSKNFPNRKQRRKILSQMKRAKKNG